ncbi:MAG TPA: DinB family protein [Thermoanaerobaculia bacterium]|nr:DinB family protein [Thermoanaerobaculia bacterium]
MNDILLNALRARITRVFPAQIRAAVQPLTDEQLWWRPNEESNSVGNVLLHLTGSLNYYLARNLGEIPYERDRAAEFAERRAIPKNDVLAMFEDMVSRAERTFDSLTPERLAGPSPEPTMHTLAVEDLVNVAAHLAFHAGQIVWIAKMFDGSAVHETWIKTHRHEGAWKGKLVQ